MQHFLSSNLVVQQILYNDSNTRKALMNLVEEKLLYSMSGSQTYNENISCIKLLQFSAECPTSNHIIHNSGVLFIFMKFINPN